MKQETKIVAIVLAFLIVFMSGFGLGATKGINIKIEGAAVQTGGQQAAVADTTTTTAAPQTTTTAAPQTTTAAPQTTTTQAPADTTTAAPADTTTAAPADTTTAAPSGSTSIPQTKAEIAAAYNKAVNDAKHYTGKVTLKKHDIIKVDVANLPSAVKGIVDNLTKTDPMEETFVNCAGTADTTRVLTNWIIPGGGRDAALQEAGVANATATANPDGGYTMNITLVAETATFDGTSNTSEPIHHMSVMDPLNLGSLDLGPVTISNADMRYPGATLTATVDSQGRLVKLEQKLPLEGTGTGKLGLSITLELSGSMDGNYEFIYG